MTRPHLLIAAIALGLGLAACASGPRQPAFVVVEENAAITNRWDIRRIGVLDDDMLIVEAGANDLYRVRLFPGCVSISDIASTAQLAETGSGLDRTSRFTFNGRSCPVRAIDKVRRVQPGEVVPPEA